MWEKWRRTSRDNRDRENARRPVRQGGLRIAGHIQAGHPEANWAASLEEVAHKAGAILVWQLTLDAVLQITCRLNIARRDASKG